MLDKLTKEQESRLPAMAAEWIERGLSTTCVPHSRMQTIARDVYRHILVKEPPRHIVCLESPLGAWIGVATLQQVDQQVYQQVRQEVERFVWPFLDGHWSAGYLAFYETLRELCMLTYPSAWAAYVATVEVGLIYPLGDYCVVSSTPRAIERDDLGRLHSEVGMAIAYRDGWGLYSWHGVTVPEIVITAPHSQTLDQIRNEQNAEVKRIRTERYGWERFLTETHAVVLDSRRNDVECTRESLMRADDMTVLVCHCPSTSRIYCLEVDPAVATCEAAQNYLWSGSRAAATYPLNLIGRS